MLVIPSIGIKQKKCTYLIQSLPEIPKIYPDDPIEVAKIWRRENARSLCLIDEDGENMGKPQNLEILKAIASELDIPIMVTGGFKTYEDVKQAIILGAMRVILDPETIEDPNFLSEAVKEFTPNRIALKILLKNTTYSAVEISSKAKKAGIERIVYKTSEKEKIDFVEIENFALKTNLKITLESEIDNYQDLKKLSELERLGVDSIIMGRSLYYNKFPCQRLWRIAESEITSNIK